eukprot:TRINITY_DN18724_c0_g1_i1.p1 TRINITY_DN18724_c0_g1~~TRINITY_DN18724_c0_g1_i1.p1  ORF type:complete len:300 (-),score=116.27 TRINITY_DN18724_c0_g1_i1:50-949(-)
MQDQILKFANADEVSQEFLSFFTKEQERLYTQNREELKKLMGKTELPTEPDDDEEITDPQETPDNNNEEDTEDRLANLFARVQEGSLSKEDEVRPETKKKMKRSVRELLGKGKAKGRQGEASKELEVVDPELIYREPREEGKMYQHYGDIGVYRTELDEDPGAGYDRIMAHLKAREREGVRLDKQEKVSPEQEVSQLIDEFTKDKDAVKAWNRHTKGLMEEMRRDRIDWNEEDVDLPSLSDFENFKFPASSGYGTEIIELREQKRRAEQMRILGKTPQSTKPSKGHPSTQPFPIRKKKR